MDARTKVNYAGITDLGAAARCNLHGIVRRGRVRG